MNALIFDMDGVLADNSDFHVQAWTAYSRQCGRDQPAPGALSAPQLGRRENAPSPAATRMREAVRSTLTPTRVSGILFRALFKDPEAPMLDSTRAKSLEDMFFYEKERGLIEARQRMEQMRETKENLAKVSGIKDDAVLSKLVSLEIRPETLATLFAVPLVEVAWADGELHPHERDALFTFARKAGFRKTEIDPTLLSVWLKHKPDPALLDAWEHYTRALCRELGEAERNALKAEVMADARTIAESAGGFLGFHKTSSQEDLMLARLEAAFGA